MEKILSFFGLAPRKKAKPADVFSGLFYDSKKSAKVFDKAIEQSIKDQRAVIDLLKKQNTTR